MSPDEGAALSEELGVQAEPPPAALPVPPKIRFDLGIEDLIAFNQFHLSTTHALKTGVFYWVFNIVLGVAVGSAFLFEQTRWYAVSFFAGVLTLSYASKLSMASRVRSLYREGENKGVFCWHELEVDGDDLVGRSPVDSFPRSIDAVERIVFRPAHVFIYYAAVAAYIVPLGKISEGDYRTFRAALVRACDKHHPNVSLD